MYLRENGKIVSELGQYVCYNIPQVKNKINELTQTNSTNDNWRELCQEAKKSSEISTVDYLYFDANGDDKDCSVNIGYDHTMRVYLVWIECD